MFKNFATLAVTAMAGAFTQSVMDDDHWSILRRNASDDDQEISDLFMSELGIKFNVEAVKWNCSQEQGSYGGSSTVYCYKNEVRYYMQRAYNLDGTPTYIAIQT